MQSNEAMKLNYRDFRAAWRALLIAASLSSVVASASGQDPEEVRIVNPKPGQALFGQVTIAVEVTPSQDVVQVEFLMDGLLIASLTKGPFILVHDFGLENRDHEIVVRAVSRSGETASARLFAPAIRIDDQVELELQQLYVTVTDRKNRRVTNLLQSDFGIRDNRTPQEIVTFAAGDIPFTAVFLLDASSSMKGERLEAALQSVRLFVDDMRAMDQAQLLAFSDRLLEATPIAEREQLAAWIQQPVEARGGSAIRDHLALAVSLLEARQGRRVIILLTDGWDRLSTIQSDQLRNMVARAQSTLFWIRLTGDDPLAIHEMVTDKPRLIHPAPSFWHSLGSLRRDYRKLERVVRASGGRILTIDGVTDLDGAVIDVLAELREQYALGYYPRWQGRADLWHEVDVRVGREGLRLRTRGGYFEQ